MKTMLRALTICLLAVATLASCKNKNNEAPQPDDSNGIIKMGISTDSLYFGVDAATKAEPTLTPDDFRVHLENTRGEELASWESYSQVPESIKALFGSYKLVASYGDLGVLPAFDAPAYGAYAKFAISPEVPVAQVTLACRPVATKISVNFDSKFSEEYSSYKVDIKTVGDSLEHNSSDVDREAYFKPGLLRFKFTVVRASEPGKEYEYYYNTNIKTKAAEHYKITFNILYTSGRLGFTITTDDSTIDKTIESGIPDFWLPRPAPVVARHSFGENKEITTPEAVSAPANVVIKTYAGVISAIIKTTSQELLDQGYPVDGVDILRATERRNLDVIALLKKLGVTWSAALDDKDEALNLTSNKPVVIDFQGVTKNLNTTPGVTTAHGFEVILVDKFNQTHDPMAFTINIAPAVLSLDALTEASIWATHAFVSCNYRSEREGYKPTPEISADQGQTWQTLDYELLSDAEGVRTFRFNKLNPSTAYNFRVKMGANIIQHPDTFTTEALLQVENSSFEDWHMDYKNGNKPFGYNIPCYYPWKSGTQPYWNTSNVRTTCYTVKRGFNQYTMASGVLYSLNAKSGNKAAEIRTVSANGGLIPCNSTNVDEVKNRTRGRLLIGSYSYTQGEYVDKIDYGRTFASRPSQMKFWYQYKPVSGDGDTFQATVKVWHQDAAVKTPLGEAIFTKYVQTPIATYQEAVVPITYSNTTLKATHITIEFLSTNDDQPRTNKNVETTYPEAGPNWRGHIGSILLVDDLELTY